MTRQLTISILIGLLAVTSTAAWSTRRAYSSFEPWALWFFDITDDGSSEITTPPTTTPVDFTTTRKNPFSSFEVMASKTYPTSDPFALTLEGSGEIAPHPTTTLVDFTTTQIPQPVSCSAGYREYDGRCYLFGKNHLSWFEAMVVCDKVSRGMLVEIYDDAERTFITQVLQELNVNAEYWIGGNDFEVSSQYTWPNTGQNVTTGFWAPNEPSSGHEHCAEIRKSGQFNDDDCHARQLYICAYDPVLCLDEDE